MEWILGSVVGCTAVAIVLFVAFVKTKGSMGTISVEEVVGVSCTVTEKIDNYAGCGQVRVGVHCWSARGANDNDEFAVGEKLKVVAVEGAKLICMK